MKSLIFISLIIFTLQDLKGIDVSVWQEKIDWKKVKASGIKFAIIRSGYVKKGTSMTVRDKYFDQNYKKAREVGMPIGSYWYAYAKTPKQAEIEALACLSIIKEHKFEWPIYYDVEDPEMRSAGKKAVSAASRTFCDILKKHKFYCGFYSSASFYSLFEDDLKNNYPIWVAHYGVNKPGYKGKWGIWQHFSKGKVDGIKGNVDLDIAKVDYEPIIKKGHYNGF
jgi:GH25 family lysozyme M1 (1,4-beta-N-acetylmuramidase)